MVGVFETDRAIGSITKLTDPNGSTKLTDPGGITTLINGLDPFVLVEAYLANSSFFASNGGVDAENASMLPSLFSSQDTSRCGSLYRHFLYCA